MPQSNFIYSFPAKEPTFYTRLSMRRYERSRPGSSISQNLQGVIRLPMPTQLMDDYNIRVNDTKFGLLGNINNYQETLAAGKSAAETATKELNSGGSIMSLMGTIALQAAATLPGISDTLPGQFAQQQAGMVRNPHISTVFEGVNLKSYSFSWRLSPSSQEEASGINSMINHIKAYMHPKIIGGGFALEYPYLANLDFEVGDVAFSQLPKVRDSFITRLDVNTSGGGSLAFYRDGNPVAIDIAMNFQEIDILTRDDFIDTSRGR